jgi:hypothetical protein
MVRVLIRRKKGEEGKFLAWPKQELGPARRLIDRRDRPLRCTARLTAALQRRTSTSTTSRGLEIVSECNPDDHPSSTRLSV